MDISFDKHSLIIDGKRTFIRSGAFHYFRTPGADMARDRFSKLKAGGYNTVDIYFNWNYHSKVHGQNDFEGIKSIRDVLQAAKDVGLYVTARPGPFINAEVNAGGLPFWLLARKDVVPRNRIGTEYHYSQGYMDLISEWYDTVIPIINEFDNVIAFQIENEYATDSMEEDYMRELYKMARDRGIKCPIFHNDAYCAGLWADVVDIYACDLYPYINPSQNWKQDSFCFDTLDNIEENVRCYKDNAPIYIAEMQSGWFDKWDGSGYKHMREALGDEHINIMTKTAISQGVTMFDHYMAVGGTSWDDLACDEVYTSYEFTAPLDEYGIVQSNFNKAKEINYFLKSFGLTDTDALETPDYGENIYAKLRQDNENNCQWFFVRNMNDEIKTINNVILRPYEMKICAQNLPLMACTVDFSDVEIFARLKNDEKEVLFVIADENAKMIIDGKEISGDKKDYDNYKFEKELGADGAEQSGVESASALNLKVLNESRVVGKKSTEFLFLTKALADRTWVLDDRVVFNADYVYHNGTIAIEKTTEIGYFDLKHGFGKKYFTVKEKAKTIDLKDFDISFCAPEIDSGYDYSTWTKVDGATDALSCEAYDEFVWYKASIPDHLEEITLSARHLFAVYINGREVLNRNSYKLEKLQEVPETIQIPLDKTILTQEKNELTILVQNLGFDKGFSGDTNYPRGLVTFETTPNADIEFYVCEKLSFERGDLRDSENAYLTKLSKTFDVEMFENVVSPMYLSLENFPYRRATIFLNGVKIGRYIKRLNVQDKFYLIDAFLKPHNTIDIVVWAKDRNIKTIWGFKSDMKNVIIQVGDERRYQLY